MAYLVFLIGYTKELRLLMNEGGWPRLAVVLICFGGILFCYGVALMPIASVKPLDGATYQANEVAAMKKLRDVPLRYHVAALLFGGMSLFLFGVVFALLRQAYRIPPNPAWAWVLAALIALVAAVGVFFALVALGAVSDPESRLGSWVHEKYLADAVAYLCSEGLIWGGFFLSLWAGSHSIYMGVAVGVAALLCWVLFFVLLVRRELDTRALDDPNDNPRASRLIDKSFERGSHDYRD